MPTQRCPNCQALNSEQAERCSLCGASLTSDPPAQPQPAAEAEPAAKPAEPDPWGAPSPAAPTQAPPSPAAPRQPAARAAGEPAVAPAAPAQLLGRAVGVGALVGTGLLVFLGLVGLVPLVGRVISIVPAVPIGRIAASTGLHVPSLPAMIVTGVLAGALTGGLVFAFKRAVAGTAFAALVFLLLRVWNFRFDWARVNFFDRAYPIIQGSALALIGAGFGAFFGYMVALAVRKHFRSIGRKDIA